MRNNFVQLEHIQSTLPSFGDLTNYTINFPNYVTGKSLQFMASSYTIQARYFIVGVISIIFALLFSSQVFNIITLPFYPHLFARLLFIIFVLVLLMGKIVDYGTILAYSKTQFFLMAIFLIILLFSLPVLAQKSVYGLFYYLPLDAKYTNAILVSEKFSSVFYVAVVASGLCYSFIEFKQSINRWLRKASLFDDFNRSCISIFKDNSEQTPFPIRWITERLLENINKGTVFGTLFFFILFEVFSYLQSFREQKEYYKAKTRFYYRLKKFGSCSQSAETFLERLKNEGDYSATLECMNGLAYLQQARYQEAERALTSCRDIDLQNIYPWYHLGYLYWQIDKLDLAIDSTKQAIMLSERSGEGGCALAFRNLAYYSTEKILRELRKPDSPGYDALISDLDIPLAFILKAYRIAEDRSQGMTPFFHTLGYILMLKGNYEYAIRCFMHSLLRRNEWGPRFHLALLHMIGDSKRFNRARYHLTYLSLISRRYSRYHKFFHLAEVELRRIRESEADDRVLDGRLLFCHAIRKNTNPLSLDAIPMLDSTWEASAAKSRISKARLNNTLRFRNHPLSFIDAQSIWHELEIQIRSDPSILTRCNDLLTAG